MVSAPSNSEYIAASQTCLQATGTVADRESDSAILALAQSHKKLIFEVTHKSPKYLFFLMIKSMFSMTLDGLCRSLPATAPASRD